MSPLSKKMKYPAAWSMAQYASQFVYLWFETVTLTGTSLRRPCVSQLKCDEWRVGSAQKDVCELSSRWRNLTNACDFSCEPFHNVSVLCQWCFCCVAVVNSRRVIPYGAWFNLLLSNIFIQKQYLFLFSLTPSCSEPSGLEIIDYQLGLAFRHSREWSHVLAWPNICPHLSTLRPNNWITKP